MTLLCDFKVSSQFAAEKNKQTNPNTDQIVTASLLSAHPSGLSYILINFSNYSSS